ncbi:hypothetical protein RCO27_02880 [Sphingosinicella sp. LHD-64]|uniref:hypothetical protein n=1 Tax=Sphingosinicella sp. LHD-64 TaxID=3072139 RepID=UPI00280F01BA|nr:hypothetical protein [Sphingosinicella sp. LHD-64]MDQ8755165.1 hypothetical protein [Sphingosinicella sp. LHD-64]
MALIGEWVIDPYVGVGPLRFGMNATEVAAIMGPPEQILERTEPREDEREQSRPVLNEYRKLGGTIEPVIEYVAGRVTLIDFPKNTRNLLLDGEDLFKTKRQALIDHLIARSDNVFETFEGFIFLDFGLSLCSAENFRSEPNIGLFARGTSDANIRFMLAEDLGEFVKGEFV